MKPGSRRFFNFSGIAASATGLTIGYYRYFAPAVHDEFSNAARPEETLFRILHLLSIPLLMLALGSVLAQHALPFLKARGAAGRRKRVTGLLLTFGTLVLIYSGSVLQVLTGETLRKFSGYFHAGVGLLLVLATMVHLRPVRRPVAVPRDAPVL